MPPLKAPDQISISIHAPAKGATKGQTFSACPFLYFNPRSREGSDFHNYGSFCNSLYFNPRSREGSDFTFSVNKEAKTIFQSTLPRRERLQIGHERIRGLKFQSTLPRRERLR